MLEYIEMLTGAEAENIKKTIQSLFRQTCILQMKCDPATLIQRDNPRYETCARHREFIGDYLSVLGCELIHDPQEHYFRLRGDGLPVEKMSLTTTQLVILLKMIYHDKIMGEGLNATVTSLAEIREYGKNTNLIARKLTRQEWQDALVLLRTHQVIELPGAIGSLEDDTPIYIYSTIQMFCTAADIGELVKRYQAEEEETENDGNAKEDHHPDVSE
ncbi:MAG: DUF4194 domain-containing protein [Lachnospiraceae bacterium]|nr:DUF4194 domain-containing protein [Lachnospiraceae bacterium]